MHSHGVPGVQTPRSYYTIYSHSEQGKLYGRAFCDGISTFLGAYFERTYYQREN